MDRPIVLGIAGGSASGKSTVVREVTRILGADICASIQHDAYYHDLSHMPFEERIKVNVDHPDSLETELLVSHLSELLEGRAIDMPDYDYVSQTRSAPGFRIEPAPVVIVEGLLVFHDERLRTLMDLKAFVDASENERLERRIERDTIERGRDRSQVQSQHENRVEPMHARFVHPTRAYADVLIPGGGHNLRAIESLAARLHALLAEP